MYGRNKLYLQLKQNKHESTYAKINHHSLTQTLYQHRYKKTHAQ